MARKTTYTPTANTALAQANAERARSSAAGTHGDRRTKRNRDRSSQRRNAIQDARS